MGNPLFADPTLPAVSNSGQVLNPLSDRRPVTLLDDHPVAYHDLAPDTTYVSPGLEYLTDENALPARVRGRLRIVGGESRVRHGAVQRRVGHQTGGTLAGRHHGGHIVAVSLGGFASGPNLFPQSANFNMSAYSRLERSWRQALRDGADVAVDIALDVGDRTTPGFVIVTHWEDGVEETIPFINEDHAQ